MLYTSLVGTLWYLTCTRPNILYGVGLVCPYMEETELTHWKAIKRIFRYIRAFTRLSKKQPIVTLLTCEAEYVVASSCVCHAIWLRRLLGEMNLSHVGATKINVDNKSAIALTKDPVHYERSKHIDVRFYFIRKYVQTDEVKLVNLTSKEQVTNIFTKSLLVEFFDKFKHLLVMRDGTNY